MSVDSNHDPLRQAPDSAALLARVAVAERRAEARLAMAIDDFFLIGDDRLDDRTRASIGATLATCVKAIAREIAGHAGRQTGAAEGLCGNDAAVLARLTDSGVLRDPALMDELFGQVRQALLSEALVANRAPGAQPALLARLTGSGDGVIAAAALAYHLADNARRAAQGGRPGELPAALHRRLVWWVAAALRPSADQAPRPNVDRALVAAAERSLAAHDDQERLDALAFRLATAIEPRADELAGLLIEALDEGHAALFVALLARGVGIDFAEARALVLDPDGDRLWLALRAQDMDRATIARIGLALCDADGRRDIEAFADILDTVAGIPADAASDALAPLSLTAEYRAALRALDRKERR